MFWKTKTPVDRLRNEVDAAFAHRVRLDMQVALMQFDLRLLIEERDRAVRVFDNLHDLFHKEPSK